MGERPQHVGVLGVLLVGGESKRMGADKATLAVPSSLPVRRLIDVAATTLAQVVETVAVVGRVGGESLCPIDEDGNALKVQQVDDAGDGPIQALAPFFASPTADNPTPSADAWTTLLIVPVDMPGLTGIALERLVALAARTDGAGAMFATGANDERVSLPVAVNRSAFAVLQQAIDAGEKRLAFTLGSLDLATVPLAPDAVDNEMANLNTPAEFAAWEATAEEDSAPNEITVDADDERLLTLMVERLVATGERRSVLDAVAEEEPLEIRVQGVSVAITMRTPGHDFELVRGFLTTEGVVTDPTDIVRIAHCDRVEDPEAEDNIVDVTLAPGVTVDLERLRRNTFASSSCGVCGKATLESALAQAGPVEDTRTLSRAMVAALPEKLRAAQEVFEATGGLHAAGVLTEAETIAVVREDVGRHNAIDKVVGHRQMSNDTDAALALVVSGRVSFEVVQKAGRARWPIIVAISAPTSLAVRLARTLNITLVGFVRNGAMNIYSHPWRITN